MERLPAEWSSDGYVGDWAVLTQDGNAHIFWAVYPIFLLSVPT